MTNEIWSQRETEASFGQLQDPKTRRNTTNATLQSHSNRIHREGKGGRREGDNQEKFFGTWGRNEMDRRSIRSRGRCHGKLRFFKKGCSLLTHNVALSEQKHEEYTPMTSMHIANKENNKTKDPSGSRRGEWPIATRHQVLPLSLTTPRQWEGSPTATPSTRKWRMNASLPDITIQLK